MCPTTFNLICKFNYLFTYWLLFTLQPGHGLGLRFLSLTEGDGKGCPRLTQDSRFWLDRIIWHHDLIQLEWRDLYHGGGSGDGGGFWGVWGYGLRVTAVCLENRQIIYTSHKRNILLESDWFICLTGDSENSYEKKVLVSKESFKLSPTSYPNTTYCWIQ